MLHRGLAEESEVSQCYTQSMVAGVLVRKMKLTLERPQLQLSRTEARVVTTKVTSSWEIQTKIVGGCATLQRAIKRIEHLSSPS
jgi:hypothetical protein